MDRYNYEPASPQLLAKWHFMMKSSMAKANEAANDWDEQSAIVNDWCRSKGFTKKQRAAYRKDDLVLREHYDTYVYYTGEVRRFTAVIQAELAMHTLHNGG